MVLKKGSFACQTFSLHMHEYRISVRSICVEKNKKNVAVLSCEWNALCDERPAAAGFPGSRSAVLSLDGGLYRQGHL